MDKTSPQTTNTNYFHLLSKPTGATCNLDCKYCFFLTKEMLYPGSRFRMTDEILESYIRQLFEAQRGVAEVNIAWQGGEPTMMGLDFFRKSIDIQKKYIQPHQTVLNTIQTNGTLLTDEWGTFFKENNFLVGISIDGPRDMHDAYRVDKGQKPTFERVMRGLEVLKRHQVDFNALTTLHTANADHPLEVYRFLRDEIGAQYMQFIPIVERVNQTGYQEGTSVTERSIKAKQYGKFLIDVFEEWVRRDVASVYVQMFDVALGSWIGMHTLCVFSPTCGRALAMEHNGDLYACDHFVEPDYFLGNIQETSMSALVNSPKQQEFGQDKLDKLPRYCQKCEVRFACHGGCPKDRFILTPQGEPGLNYLCAGYKMFFKHIDEPMRFMANELNHDRAPFNVIAYYTQKDAEIQKRYAEAKPTDRCPCGSGKRFDKCHGKKNNL